MILFSAELSKKTEYNPIAGTPSNDHDRNYNIYELHTGERPRESYWIDWGGFYDNVTANQVELYFSGFLRRANSFEELYITEKSLFISDDFVYFNIPMHPWLYRETEAALRQRLGFLSGPKDPYNPSDNIIDDEIFETRLVVPAFNIKLSDAISGLTKYSTFEFTLLNNDGYFDETDSINYFNAPVYIKKSWKENPESSDFITIRAGFVENVKIDEKSVTFSCADKFRSLEEPVCNVINERSYIDVLESAIGKEIPVVYGEAEINLIDIGENRYVAAEYVSYVYGVYNSNGEDIPYSFNNGIISAEKASYSKIVGYLNNKIGEIIIDLVGRKSILPYTETNWDKNETDEYIEESPEINITIKSGAVNTAIKKILQSDMAFLIQKNSGEFTLRKWDKIYDYHEIGFWKTTQYPKKDYNDAQQQFFTSCIIKYNLNERTSNYEKQLLYDVNESESEGLYNKKYRETYETNLINEIDVFILATALSNRFSFLKDSLTLATGEEISAYNLLDFVKLNININDRKYSKNNYWIVKEIDPAQDRLILEPGVINDYSNEYAFTTLFDYEFDNRYAATKDFEMVLDGMEG